MPCLGEQLEKLYSWINASHPNDDFYKRLLSLRHPGTCEWILADETFQDFVSAPHLGRSVLWVTGIPGCGKSGVLRCPPIT